jgi:GR25 family glycosyltransferase involved in LPS biosynthesis
MCSGAEPVSALPKPLCIGMATYDDYDGVYFTAQSIRLYHPEVTSETEILVIDNHPEGPCAAELKGLEDFIEGYRYVPWNRSAGTSVRDIVFREANAAFVLCVDSHVLFAPGALRRLLDYITANPGTPDLLQGPLLYDDLRTLSTHMEPRWSCGMYGVWGTDERAADPDASPFEIVMQGLGVFGCRRSAWPGFNPRLKGFGSEEGYIQEKFRRAGGRTLCLPFLRWVHRFGRPMGARYENAWEDRIRNYMIVANELGRDCSDVVDHFRMHLGAETANRIVACVSDDLRSPFNFFDAIYCINLDTAADRWQSVTSRFERVGIAQRIRRFPAISTPPNLHIGCALSHRSIVQEAQRQGLKNVLVFEDDVILTGDAPSHLQTAVQELDGRNWDLLYLGACRWEHRFPMVEGCTRLEHAGPVTTTHAIAYRESVYDRILGEVPDEASSVEDWLKTHHGIDQYYAFCIKQGKYLLSPVIATQAAILPMENDDVIRRIARSSCQARQEQNQ